MQNLLALIVIIVVVYLIMNVIARKKLELKEKEKLQREQFLQETQALLKTDTPIKTDPIPPKIEKQAYRSYVSEYFTAQGYIISEYAHDNGIDFIGVKEKELIMICCDNSDKEIKENTIKAFIADCTIHIEKNPMLSNRTVKRIYVTPKALNDPEASNFIHAHAQSIHYLLLRMPSKQ